MSGLWTSTFTFGIFFKMIPPNLAAYSIERIGNSLLLRFTSTLNVWKFLFFIISKTVSLIVSSVLSVLYAMWYAWIPNTSPNFFWTSDKLSDEIIILDGSEIISQEMFFSFAWIFCFNVWTKKFRLPFLVVNSPYSIKITCSIILPPYRYI